MSWIEAAKQGNLTELDQLGPDIGTFKTDLGITPLHYAAAGGHDRAVELLLGRNARPDAEDMFKRTPLYLAVANGHLIVVEQLLKKNVNAKVVCVCGTSAVAKAAEHGRDDILRLLSQRGAPLLSHNVDGETPDDLARRNGFGNMMKAYINKAEREFFTAAKQGDVLKLRSLISTGVSIKTRNILNQSALDVAARYGKLEAVSALLDANADPKLRDAESGTTALHLAAGNGHEAIVKCLINAMADVNAQDRDGLTPLHRAAQKGHVRAARELLDNGAQPNLVGMNGVAPLHSAAQHGREEMVNLLIGRHADRTLRDNQGRTASDRAATGQHDAIERLLL